MVAVLQQPEHRRCATGSKRGAHRSTPQLPEHRLPHLLGPSAVLFCSMDVRMPASAAPSDSCGDKARQGHSSEPQACRAWQASQ